MSTLASHADERSWALSVVTLESQLNSDHVRVTCPADEREGLVTPPLRHFAGARVVNLALRLGRGCGHLIASTFTPSCGVALLM